MTRKRTSRTPARIAFTGAAALALAAVATACTTTHDGDPEHRTFKLSGVAKTLTIDSRDTAIELVPVDREGTDIKVTRWFKAEKWNGKTGVSWSAEGDTLKFRTKCSGVIVDCSARHRVEVPRDLDVKVIERDGSVKAAGFDTKLDISTHDGSVNVKDSSGPLKLHSKDGSVRATGISATTVEAGSADGSIHLAFAKAPERVDVTGSDGSARIEVPDSAYKVDADADDGSVQVDVTKDDTSPRSITARTKDGSIAITTV